MILIIAIFVMFMIMCVLYIAAILSIWLLLAFIELFIAYFIIRLLIKLLKKMYFHMANYQSRCNREKQLLVIQFKGLVVIICVFWVGVTLSIWILISFTQLAIKYFIIRLLIKIDFNITGYRLKCNREKQLLVIQFEGGTI